MTETVAKPLSHLAQRRAVTKKHEELVHEYLGTKKNTGHVPSISTDDPPQLGNVETLEGIKKLTDRMVKLDHAKAFWYVGLPVFRCERIAGDPHTQFLFDQMKLGRFNWDNVILATAVFNGVTYKINGQHTCWAVTFMPESFVVEVREKQYEVSSEEQLRALYNSFDAGKPRSVNHRTKIEMTAIPELDSLWNNLLPQLGRAFLFWRFESSTQRSRYSSNPAATVQLIRDGFLDLVKSVGEFYQYVGKDSKNIRRLPVCAAMLATFNKVPSVAPDFWRPVADGTNLASKNDPRWRLREYLTTHTLGVASSGDRTPVSPEDMYRICVHCWNKWRKNEQLTTTPRTTKDRVNPA